MNDDDVRELFGPLRDGVVRVADAAAAHARVHCGHGIDLMDDCECCGVRIRVAVIGDEVERLLVELRTRVDEIIDTARSIVSARDCAECTDLWTALVELQLGEEVAELRIQRPGDAIERQG